MLRAPSPECRLESSLNAGPFSIGDAAFARQILGLHWGLDQGRRLGKTSSRFLETELSAQWRHYTPE